MRHRLKGSNRSTEGRGRGTSCRCPRIPSRGRWPFRFPTCRSRSSPRSRCSRWYLRSSSTRRSSPPRSPRSRSQWTTRRARRWSTRTSTRRIDVRMPARSAAVCAVCMRKRRCERRLCVNWRASHGAWGGPRAMPEPSAPPPPLRSGPPAVDRAHLAEVERRDRVRARLDHAPEAVPELARPARALRRAPAEICAVATGAIGHFPPTSFWHENVASDVDAEAGQAHFAVRAVGHASLQAMGSRRRGDRPAGTSRWFPECRSGTARERRRSSCRS